jgi:hypothetical protein
MAVKNTTQSKRILRRLDDLCKNTVLLNYDLADTVLTESKQQLKNSPKSFYWSLIVDEVTRAIDYARYGDVYGYWYNAPKLCFQSARYCLKIILDDQRN